MGHVKQEIGHWTWVGEDGKSTWVKWLWVLADGKWLSAFYQLVILISYECELMESDYLPSISFEKFPVGGWYWDYSVSSAPFVSKLRLRFEFRKVSGSGGCKMVRLFAVLVRLLHSMIIASALLLLFLNWDY